MTDSSNGSNSKKKRELPPALERNKFKKGKVPPHIYGNRAKLTEEDIALLWLATRDPALDHKSASEVFGVNTDYIRKVQRANKKPERVNRILEKNFGIINTPVQGCWTKSVPGDQNLKSTRRPDSEIVDKRIPRKPCPSKAQLRRMWAIKFGEAPNLTISKKQIKSSKSIAADKYRS